MQVVAKKRLQSSDSHWFIFLLLPFFASLTALKNYRAGWAKNVVWAFIVYYGFTFASAKESLDTADINRYVDDLKDLYGRSLGFYDVLEIIKDSGEVDILRTLIAIIVSRFSQSSAVLTAVYGFIFGFFFTRNLWYLLERLKGKLKGMVVFFLLVFFLINPIWNINGFRFNTAALVFVYGALPYLYENKKSRLIFCFASILVHFSFLFLVAFLIIYIFAGNRKTVYFVFFIASVFFNNLNIGQFNSFLEQNLPEVFLERSKNYREEGRVDEFREHDESVKIERETGKFIKKNWYAVYYMRCMYWSLTLLLIGLYIFGKNIFAGSKWLLNGYCLSLLLFGAGNVMQSLPSGERFMMIASLLTVSVIVFYLQNQAHELYISRITVIAMPLLLLYVTVSLRNGLYTISVNTILGNPFFAMLTDYNLSLNDIIK
jgi:EpsG family